MVTLLYLGYKCPSSLCVVLFQHKRDFSGQMSWQLIRLWAHLRDQRQESPLEKQTLVQSGMGRHPTVAYHSRRLTRPYWPATHLITYLPFHLYLYCIYLVSILNQNRKHRCNIWIKEILCCLDLSEKKFYIARVQIPCATDKRVYITSTTFDKTIKK